MPLYFLQRVFLRFTAHGLQQTIKHMTIVTTTQRNDKNCQIIPGFEIPGGFGPGGSLKLEQCWKFQILHFVHPLTKLQRRVLCHFGLEN